MLFCRTNLPHLQLAPNSDYWIFSNNSQVSLTLNTKSGEANLGPQYRMNPHHLALSSPLLKLGDQITLARTTVAIAMMKLVVQPKTPRPRPRLQRAAAFEVGLESRARGWPKTLIIQRKAFHTQQRSVRARVQLLDHGRRSLPIKISSWTMLRKRLRPKQLPPTDPHPRELTPPLRNCSLL